MIIVLSCDLSNFCDMLLIKILQTKIEKGEYANEKEFGSDMRLIFSNCYRYNPPGHDVVLMAKELEVRNLFGLYFFVIIFNYCCMRGLFYITRENSM